jgi:hypothetical protein
MSMLLRASSCKLLTGPHASHGPPDSTSPYGSITNSLLVLTTRVREPERLGNDRTPPTDLDRGLRGLAPIVLFVNSA